MGKRTLFFLVCSMLLLLMGCTKEMMVAGNHMGSEFSMDDKKDMQMKLPEKVEPMDVPSINQMDDPRLYNGCEVTSLAMMSNYHGYDVTKNELANQMPSVPLTYENGLKGNPNKGFVGDMVDGPGLSVYHEPIYNLAKTYAGDKAVDITGSSIQTLYRYLSQGLPVWVIITVDFSPAQDMKTWETPSGMVDVTFQVHSVVITGYDEEHIYVNDPYGFKNRQVDKEDFVAAWEQLGQQAIVIKE